jgi:hypothetical protein
VRKLAAALLAVPVVALVYLAAVLQRSILLRVAVTLGAGSLLGFGLLALVAPPGGTARSSSVRIPPSAAFVPIVVDQALTSPVAVQFTAPMDPGSVAAALTVNPPVPVRLEWAPDARQVLVWPLSRWAPATFYTVTVGADARDATGTPLAATVRAAFLTRPAAVARIGLLPDVAGPAPVTAEIVVAFDRPVDLPSLTAALKIDPPVPETLAAVEPGSAARVVFRPTAPLQPGTRYTVQLAGPVHDADGIAVVLPAPLAFTTESAPTVVRFRPRDGSSGISPDQLLSVRFSAAMDRSSTEAAFRATVDGRPIAGRRWWAEGDTVLVLDPDRPLPWGGRVVLQVDGGARSAGGAPLAAPARASFTVAPAPAPATTGPARPSGGGGSSPGTAPSGPWAGAERFYLSLLNCTRTGGTVGSDGRCRGGGSGLPPLVLDAGISSRVARPYARLLAEANLCTHFADGNPGDRLRRAGYTQPEWGENVGCRDGDPLAAVLGSHLYFQSEGAWRPPGGHWANIMNPRFSRVGIGVWVSGGRVRLVVDFLGA